MKKQFVQQNPIHPGVILLELYLQPLNLNVTQAAEKLKISRPNFSAIVNGKAGISAFMAIKLAKAFNTTPQYWMNMQAGYDLAIAHQKESHIINEIEVLV